VSTHSDCRKQSHQVGGVISDTSSTQPSLTTQSQIPKAHASEPTPTAMWQSPTCSVLGLTPKPQTEHDTQGSATLPGEVARPIPGGYLLSHFRGKGPETPNCPSSLLRRPLCDPARPKKHSPEYARAQLSTQRTQRIPHILMHQHPSTGHSLIDRRGWPKQLSACRPIPPGCSSHPEREKVP